MRAMWRVRRDVERNMCSTLKTRVKSKKGKKLASINQSESGGCVVECWYHLAVA